MIRSASVLIVALAVLGMSSMVQAELIPTPDFSNHPIPTTSVASPHASWWAVADMLALAVALCLATYFALVSRSRNKLLLLTVASLAYFGFVRGGCVCPIGATQNVALAMSTPSYVVPITVVVFFTLPLVFTLFFGRTFCAAVCPLGAVQELVAVRSVRVPPWLDQSLGMLAYIYLGVAIILAATNTAFVICRFDPFVAMFRLSGSVPMLVFGGCLLFLGVFVGRPYCRYLCPYGAILRVLSRCRQMARAHSAGGLHQLSPLRRRLPLRCHSDTHDGAAPHGAAKRQDSPRLDAGAGIAVDRRWSGCGPSVRPAPSALEPGGELGRAAAARRTWFDD